MRLVVAALAAVLATPLAAAPPRPIAGLANIEDMVLLRGGRWVVASSMAGGRQSAGRLYLIDARTGAARQAYPGTVAARPAPDSDCAAEVPRERFAPHGLAMRDSRAGTELLVVHHGARETIERFAVEGGRAPRLRWSGCLALPPGARGNGVAAAGDTIVLANIGTPRLAGAPAVGNVLRWTRASGWRAVPGSEMRSPNGILLSPDGARIYLAGWRSRTIFEFALAGDAPPRKAAVAFLPDNLRWDGGGHLLVAGQFTEPETIVACVFGALERCGADFGVARIAVADMRVTCAVRLAARPTFDSATTALRVGRAIWLGTTRGDAVDRRSPAPC